MLMCSAPVYRDVLDDWRHPRRKKKNETKLGELPSYLRGEVSPSKSRKEDLSGDVLMPRFALVSAPMCRGVRATPVCVPRAVLCRTLTAQHPAHSLPRGAGRGLRCARLAG